MRFIFIAVALFLAGFAVIGPQRADCSEPVISIDGGGGIVYEDGKIDCNGSLRLKLNAGAESRVSASIAYTAEDASLSRGMTAVSISLSWPGKEDTSYLDIAAEGDKLSATYGTRLFEIDLGNGARLATGLEGGLRKGSYDRLYCSLNPTYNDRYDRTKLSFRLYVCEDRKPAGFIDEEEEEAEDEAENADDPYDYGTAMQRKLEITGEHLSLDKERLKWSIKTLSVVRPDKPYEKLTLSAGFDKYLKNSPFGNGVDLILSVELGGNSKKSLPGSELNENRVEFGSGVRGIAGEAECGLFIDYVSITNESGKNKKLYSADLFFEGDLFGGIVNASIKYEKNDKEGNWQTPGQEEELSYEVEWVKQLGRDGELKTLLYCLQKKENSTGASMPSLYGIRLEATWKFKNIVEINVR